MSTTSAIRFEFSARRDNYWKEAIARNNPVAYEAFLREYPSGQYTDEAKIRREGLIFSRAQEIDMVLIYEEYLSMFPSGGNSEQVRVRLAQLKTKSASSTGEKGGSLERISTSIFTQGNESAPFSKKPAKKPSEAEIERDLTRALGLQGIEVVSAEQINNFPRLKVLYREVSGFGTTPVQSGGSAGFTINPQVAGQLYWEMCDDATHLIGFGTEKFVLPGNPGVFMSEIMDARRKIFEAVASSVKSSYGNLK